jgi:hypothetical protein
VLIIFIHKAFEVEKDKHLDVQIQSWIKKELKDFEWMPSEGNYFRNPPKDFKPTQFETLPEKCSGITLNLANIEK